MITVCHMSSACLRSCAIRSVMFRDFFVDLWHCAVQRLCHDSRLPALLRQMLNHFRYVVKDLWHRDIHIWLALRNALLVSGLGRLDELFHDLQCGDVGDIAVLACDHPLPSPVSASLLLLSLFFSLPLLLLHRQVSSHGVAPKLTWHLQCTSRTLRLPVSETVLRKKLKGHSQFLDDLSPWPSMEAVLQKEE